MMGLSVPRSATMRNPKTDDIFWAKVPTYIDFKGLFDYMKGKGEWAGCQGVLQYEKEAEDGTPIDATLTEFIEP